MTGVTKDISEEVCRAKELVIRGGNTPGDCWQDYIDWKSLRSAGVDKIIIDGLVYECGKWGPKDIIKI